MDDPGHIQRPPGDLARRFLFEDADIRGETVLITSAFRDILAIHQYAPAVAGLLGEDFDLPAFQGAYGTLNQVEFHPFTGDNQDYLAYICLVLGGGVFNLDAVVQDVRERRITSFREFIDAVDARRVDLPDISVIMRIVRI